MKKQVKFFTGWHMKIVADKNIPLVREAFSGFGEVVMPPGRDITASVVRDADILLVRTVTHVNKNLLESSSVKFVGTATIGFDHIDVSYLEKNGIAFSPAAGCNANSVAEYIIASLLILAERYDLNLQDLTLGVVGVGNVGGKVVEKTRALGMEVLLNDPPKARERAAGGAVYNRQNKNGFPEFISLKEVLEKSDIVSMHVPLTFEGEDATDHMANLGFFNKMKDGSFFINTARGAVVDTHALLHALYHGKVKSAVIDVWDGEPKIPVTLLDCIDIGTPHIAGYSLDGKVNATRILYEAACTHFGIRPEWHPRELPKPRYPVITIPKSRTGNRSILGYVVKKAYDIQRDDRELWKMLNLPADKRPAYFDRLRNEYPVRREFHSMTVCTNENNRNVEPVLKGLGFRLNFKQRRKESKAKRSIYHE